MSGLTAAQRQRVTDFVRDAKSASSSSTLDKEAFINAVKQLAAGEDTSVLSLCLSFSLCLSVSLCVTL